MRKLLVALFVILALVFLGAAIYYFVTPAGKLPHLSMLGYIPGSTHIHSKHGIAALVVAVGFGILAWFYSGKKSSEPTT
jgi:hypothetical protein